MPVHDPGVADMTRSRSRNTKRTTLGERRPLHCLFTTVLVTWFYFGQFTLSFGQSPVSVPVPWILPPATALRSPTWRSFIVSVFSINVIFFFTVSSLSTTHIGS